MLAFTHRREIPELPYATPETRSVPALTPYRAAMSEIDRMQLTAIVRRFEPSIADEDAVFAMTYGSIGAHLRGFFECPTEWWDVLEDGQLTYQLWLYSADCGVLFAANTTDEVAPINRFAFYGEGWEGTAPGSLAEQLEQAQRALPPTMPRTAVAGVAFVDRSGAEPSE